MEGCALGPDVLQVIGGHRLRTGPGQPVDSTVRTTLVGANTLDLTTNGFRCDSARFLPTKQGCSFDLVESNWGDLRLSDPKISKTSRHVTDAQTNPSVTYPQFAGKRIPGSIDSSEPLSRIYHDQARRDANHAAAVKVCKNVWGADYATGGFECDEYPMQSTTQGAAYGNNQFSARRIPKADNQLAGSKLAAWYGRERMLDGDQFYVLVRR